MLTRLPDIILTGMTGTSMALVKVITPSPNLIVPLSPLLLRVQQQRQRHPQALLLLLLFCPRLQVFPLVSQNDVVVVAIVVVIMIKIMAFQYRPLPLYSLQATVRLLLCLLILAIIVLTEVIIILFRTILSILTNTVVVLT